MEPPERGHGTGRKELVNLRIYVLLGLGDDRGTGIREGVGDHLLDRFSLCRDDAKLALLNVGDEDGIHDHIIECRPEDLDLIHGRTIRHRETAPNQACRGEEIGDWLVFGGY